MCVCAECLCTGLGGKLVRTYVINSHPLHGDVGLKLNNMLSLVISSYRMHGR